jgi:hypothetical protein
MANQGRLRLRLHAASRELRGVAIALLMVAATTVIAYAMIRYLDIRRGSVIYLIPVLLAGWHLGLVPALVAAAAGCSGRVISSILPTMRTLSRGLSKSSISLCSWWSRW